METADEPTWVGPLHPKMLLVGEAWGEQEQMVQRPFVGHSGQELWRMLGEANPTCDPEAHASAASSMRYGAAWIRHRLNWLISAEIAFTNVFNLHPTENKLDYLCWTKKEGAKAEPEWQVMKGKYLQEQFRQEVFNLRERIAKAAPNVVVPLGNTAMWATLGTGAISGLRGSVSVQAGQKYLPTFHPAGVLRNWAWREITVFDLTKAFRESRFQELRRPRRQVLIDPSATEVVHWTNETLAARLPWLAVDIETEKGQITSIGFARSAQEALVIPFVDKRQPGFSYWPSASAEAEAWDQATRLLACPTPKVFQNGLYDLQYILPMGITPVACLEDTMLLHHSLYPELQKSLGFLGSIYTDESSWKLMRKHKGDEVGVKKDE